MLPFWGLLIYLFLICFYRLLTVLNNTDYQLIIINQQDFKISVTMPSGSFGSSLRLVFLLLQVVLA